MLVCARKVRALATLTQASSDGLEHSSLYLPETLILHHLKSFFLLQWENEDMRALQGGTAHADAWPTVYKGCRDDMQIWFIAIDLWKSHSRPSPMSHPVWSRSDDNDYLVHSLCFSMDGGEKKEIPFLLWLSFLRRGFYLSLLWPLFLLEEAFFQNNNKRCFNCRIGTACIGVRFKDVR